MIHIVRWWNQFHSRPKSSQVSWGLEYGTKGIAGDVVNESKSGVRALDSETGECGRTFCFSLPSPVQSRGGHVAGAILPGAKNAQSETIDRDHLPEYERNQSAGRSKKQRPIHSRFQAVLWPNARRTSSTSADYSRPPERDRPGTPTA